MSAPPIRVLLADDHPALRVGLRVLLDREPDIDVVAEAADGAELLSRMREGEPHVVVLDCQLPGTSGVAIAAMLHESAPPVRVLALSAYDDDRYLAGMAKAGARGYLLKSEAPGQIVAAVRAVNRGEELWTADQRARIERWRAEVERVRASLTASELEVLQYIADGLSNKEIASALSITVRTTDFHASNIFRKLGVISRVEAALWAAEHLS